MSSLPLDPADPCHVDTVLGSVIQPLLQACRMGGQTLSKGDMALFMLNNVSAVRVSYAYVTRGLFIRLVVCAQGCIDLLTSVVTQWTNRSLSFIICSALFFVSPQNVLSAASLRSDAGPGRLGVSNTWFELLNTEVRGTIIARLFVCLYSCLCVCVRLFSC